MNPAPCSEPCGEARLPASGRRVLSSATGKGSLSGNSRKKKPEFKHWYDLSVRWGDLDALGHVNNARFFTYLESARLAYLDESGVWPLAARTLEGPILARVTCDFLQEIRFPGDVWVGTRVIRLGRRSLHAEQGIFAPDRSTLLASSDSVLVWFDYQKRRSIEVPAAVRQKLAAFEGSSLEGTGCSQEKA